MPQTIQAKDINLAQLSEKFHLELAENEQFFQEWQENLTELTDLEKQSLDSIKTDYLHLAKYPVLEPIVKMVVLSPLLKLAGFYRPPFYLAAEKEVENTSEDNGTVVRGRIDILIFKPQFWILVIEAKKTQFSLEVGIPQILLYMLTNPETENPTFGLVTNGMDFIFLKLIKQETPRYALSYPFSLRRGNDIYTVLSILKRLSQLVSNADATQ